MEIVTYVLSGKLEHRDSIGNHGVVGPGGVQYMSAGSGVRHSEFNHSPDEGLHFLQMWVLPGNLGGPPSYGQVDFDADRRRNKWLLVASGNDRSAPVRLTQNATLHVSRLEGAQLQHAFDARRLGFLFVAEGTIAVSAFSGDDAAGSAELQAGDAVRLGGVSQITLHGTGEIVLWALPIVDDNAL
jgi:quercetin 2,3-dioxygenase